MGRRLIARKIPLTVTYPENTPRIMAETAVAKTMVARMRLFTVAELTN